VGLDITAFALVDLEPVPRAGDDDWPEYIAVWNHPSHECRALPLEKRPDKDGRPSVRYRVDRGRSISFRAGSYSGYNQFRKELCRMSHGVDPDVIWAACQEHGGCVPGPFVEMINFSDAEGLIGPEACARLADDFDEYHEKAKGCLEGWHLETYEDFRRAFRLAAGTGCVEFH
jgi:hypothetical protein